MADKAMSVSEIRVLDPLSLVTRRERRNLLLTSTIGLIMYYTGLVPSKLSALGIEFTSTEKEWFFLIIIFMIVYFTVTFIIYSASDFVAWRISFNSTRLDHLTNRVDKEEEDSQGDKNEIYNVVNKLYNWRAVSLPVTILRVFIEFIFPILLSIYTIFTLL